MIALDLMGAGESLSTQTIMIRIQSINAEKLGKQVGGGVAGAAIGPALLIVDQAPKLAIDMALPVLKSELEKAGITAEVAVTNSPPPARPPSEAPAAFAVGVGCGAALALVGGWVYNWVKTRTKGAAK